MDPYKQLAGVIDKRMKTHTKIATAGISAELGVITVQGVKLDNFKYEFQEYFIADYLTLEEPDFTVTEETLEHTHQVKTPAQLEKLKVGDRVLAVPINNGNDLVIIARVVKHSG